ncbi:TRAP transporter substrate-binding protein [Poseidonocella sp. HB161398]|uniref:TRAP transporter substrate-binding protein n=1 Tax=Poseidonocella sp. HB161398 TaxID=2320855 RepID=UPI0011097797|nr:TRAP transporter substrate-binding protein [Poseidonocella sp. HB161398]
MNAIFPLFAGSALALCAATADADKIRVAGNFATEHSSSLAMQKFKEEVESLTDGALTVDIFPAQQLGGAAENVQAVKLGAVEIIWVGSAYLSRTVPDLAAVSMPFQFSGRDEAFATVDGPIGAAIDAKLAGEGMKSLGYMELGFRQLTNNVRPVESVEDIEGLKIRLQPNETHMATFRALGANPVAMDVKELYSAMEQGVIDGQENPFAIIDVAGYAEVQKYVSNTNHFFDFISVVTNQDKFDALSPEFQEAVTTAMADAVAFQRQLAAEQDAAALDKLVADGMTYSEVSPDFAAALRAATAPVAVEARKALSPEIAAMLAGETPVSQ